VTLGDGVFRKSPMKMIYRKLPKTASLSVTCHSLSTYGMRPEFIFRASQVAQTESQPLYRRSSQRQTIMAHTYTDAVTDNARIAIKRWLRLSANIRSSSRHAKALL
jgi:hypothetical protein